MAVSGTDLYAGGDFTDAGGDTNADYIAKWDGSHWRALGTGLSYSVCAIAVLGTDIYVGGGFTNAGGDTNANRIAKWDGAHWQALGAGLNNSVRAIAVSGSNLYAGGVFTDAGGDTNADYIAKWDGSHWRALGAGINASGYDLNISTITISGTDIYIGGHFANAGGDTNANSIAKWDGTKWQAIEAGLKGDPYICAIAISDSDIYVGGYFTDAGGDTNTDYIVKWDGSEWQALGVGLNSYVYVYTIAISGTNIYIGGSFATAGGSPASHFACWHVVPVGIEDKTPHQNMLSLATNYPNPFNASVNINYQLAVSGQVVLKVYDVMGQEVRSLVDEYQTTGMKTIQWDGRDRDGKQVANGVYVYRLQVGDVVESRRVQLIR
jgi:hypothetical protein